MPKPRRALLCSLCAASMMFAVTPAALGAKGRTPRNRPAGGGELEHKRDEAKRKEAEVRHDLDLAQASETELERHLAQISTDLGRRQADAATAASDAEAATASVSRISADIIGLKDELGHRREIFNRRAVLAYMSGQARPLDDLALAGELLSMPADLTDAARRSEIMKRVSEQDNDAYANLLDTQDRLARDEVALSKARDRAHQRAADARDAVAAVAQLKKAQEAAKAVLDQRIADLASEADALAAAQSQLEGLIRQRQAALEATRRARAAVGNTGGNLRRLLPTTGSVISPTGFIWPVDGVLTSGFGPRWGRMHTGIDIAAPAGTPIHAAKAGEVIYAGWLNGYGNTVVIDHSDGVATLYGHQSRLGSTEGQAVNQGDVVGFVGSTGHSTGNHLHFEVRIDAAPRNPRPYLP